MKTAYRQLLLLIIITIGISDNSFAQTRRLMYSEHMDAFIGTWVYSDGNSEFRLVLIKGRLNTDDGYGDYILGGYSYRRNGILICDYTQNIPTEFTEVSYEFDTSPACSGTNGSYNPRMGSATIARLSISDFVYHKSGDATFTLLSPTTARFKLSDSWSSREEPNVRQGFSIPTDVVLTKLQ